MKESGIVASAADDYTKGAYGDYTYNKYADHIEITGCRESVRVASIPSRISGLPVTVIGSYAFDDMDLVSVKIPDSVTILDNGCFSGCDKLSSLTLSSNIRRIEEHAFSECSALTSFNFPNKVEYIGEWAFKGCT